MKNLLLFLIVVILLSACGPEDKTSNSEKVADNSSESIAEPSTSVKLISIKSSSNLKEGVHIYDAHNLLDADKNTSWVEGAAGDGVSESITLTFSETTKVQSIKFVNGFSRYYKQNNRVKDISIETDSGEKAAATLKDTNDEQLVEFSPVSGKVLSIKIKSVYKGTQFTDTALSELSIPAIENKTIRTHENTQLTYYVGRWVNEGEQTSMVLNSSGRGKMTLPGSSGNSAEKKTMNLYWSATETTLTIQLKENHPWYKKKTLAYEYMVTEVQEMLNINGSMAFYKAE